MRATRRIRVALAWLALAACAMALASGALAEALTISVKVNGAACTVNAVDVATDEVVASRDFAKDELADLQFTASADAAYRISLAGNGESADVDYDQTAYILTNPGTWVMYVEGKSANDKKETAVFTNTDKAQTATPFIDPPVTKRIEGEGAPQATFTFAMEAVENDAGYSLSDMPMPNGQPGPIATARVVGQGTTEFGRIDFDRAGTYVYRVTEVVDNAPGYTYDQAEYAVIAEVTEADGKLVVASRVTRDGAPADDIVFTNRYSAAAPDGATENESAEGTTAPGASVAPASTPEDTATTPTATATAEPTPTPTATATATPGSSGSSGGSNGGASPRTGDERNLELWIGASAALLCVIVALAIYYLRSRRRDKRTK